MAKRYDDYLLAAGRDAINDIDREMREITNGIETARADGDTYSLGTLVRNANALQNERDKLVERYNQHYNQATAPAKPLTGQEMMHMDASRLDDQNIMNQTRQWMMGQSKYWNEADWNDPTVQQRVREGSEKHAILRKSKEYWG
jgi:hypothetical protein